MKPESSMRSAYRAAVHLPPPAAAAMFRGRTPKALVGLVAQLHKRAGGEPFALHQGDVAAAMVVTKETISAALKQLRAAGVLRLESSGGRASAGRASTYTYQAGEPGERPVVSDE